MLKSHLAFTAMMLCFAQATTLVAAEDAPASGVVFRLAETEPGEGLTKAVVLHQEKFVYLHADTLVSDQDVSSVTFDRDESGHVGISITIEPAAAKRLSAATKEHLDKPIAIVLDGVVITAPIIRAEISNKARLTGNFSDAELSRLFRALVLHSAIAVEPK